MFKKFLYFVISGLILGCIFIVIFTGSKTPIFGVSFSIVDAVSLNLNWQQAYLDILNDLKVKNLRLIAYWHQIEPEKNQYNFDNLDWMLDKAMSREANIILVLGRRLPRWPECHIPSWAQNLTEGDQQKEILELIEKLVERYKNNINIKYWQVENEPFATWFKNCQSPIKSYEKINERGISYENVSAEAKSAKEFLKAEIDLVKKIDPSRPVIITESGELSTWIRGALYGDVLGISIYRIVWNKYLGYLIYPYLPEFYKIKAFIIKNIFRPKNIIVTELQAEPWAPSSDLLQVPLDEQYKSMTLNRLNKNINFAKRAGFEENYLWGAEWWYWMKEKNKDSSFWDEVKKLMQTQN